MPPDTATPLERCAAGALPPNVALMQLCLGAAHEGSARQALDDAIALASGPARERLDDMAALWRQTPGAFDLVRAVAATAGDAAAPERWAVAFDGAAALSPEGSVALYSLGRSDLLQAATAEIVGLLRRHGWLAPDARVLDLGCGIGRLVQAIAPLVREVIGIDISRAMLDEAERRCATLGNVRLLQGDGRSLAGIAEDSVDLVLSVDAFPYLVAGGEGLVTANLREARRVLRADRPLVIMNYAYGGDEVSHQRDLARLAGAAGLRVRRGGERPFRLWDGIVYELAWPVSTRAQTA